MHGWFVCPTVSVVTTSHATGLEKTLLLSRNYDVTLSAKKNHKTVLPLCVSHVTRDTRLAQKGVTGDFYFKFLQNNFFSKNGQYFPTNKINKVEKKKLRPPDWLLF